MPVTINGTTGIAGPDGSASTPAVQGTDSNTGLFYPAADTVALSTGGSERMRITSAGNVGIGTSAPAKPFNLVTSGTTEAWFESTSTQKAILSLVAGDNAVGLTSTYNSGGTAARPFIFYNVSTSLLQFDLGKTVALQGATSKTGIGITFPSDTTSTVSSDANTLDDYEEGTWTPTLTGASSDPTVTYTTQTGQYTKVGRVVHVQCSIVPATYSGGSGVLRIAGLPFTSGSSTFYVTGSAYLDGVDIGASRTWATSYVAPGVSYIRLITSQNNGAASDVLVGGVSAGDNIIIGITYMV